MQHEEDQKLCSSFGQDMLTQENEAHEELKKSWLDRITKLFDLTSSPSISKNVLPSVSKNVSPSVSKNVLPSVSKNISPSVSKNVSPSVSKNVLPSVSGELNLPPGFEIKMLFPNIEGEIIFKQKDGKTMWMCEFGITGIFDNTNYMDTRNNYGDDGDKCNKFVDDYNDTSSDKYDNKSSSKCDDDKYKDKCDNNFNDRYNDRHNYNNEDIKNDKYDDDKNNINRLKEMARYYYEVKLNTDSDDNKSTHMTLSRQTIFLLQVSTTIDHVQDLYIGHAHVFKSTQDAVNYLCKNIVAVDSWTIQMFLRAGLMVENPSGNKIIEKLIANSISFYNNAPRDQILRLMYLGMRSMHQSFEYDKIHRLVQV